MLAGDDDEAGIRLGDVGRAIMIWVAMNDGKSQVSVADAAMMFNTTPELVRAAIEEDPWATIIGADYVDPRRQIIVDDGE